MAELKKMKLEKTTATVSAEQIGLNARHSVKSREFAQWVRALRQNWRQGTVGVKDRSEVSLSNRKPWKQKGTGRARAGTFRSPLWRKGGVIFGPQPRTRTLSVAQHTRNRVLNAVLWQFIDSGRLCKLAFVLPSDAAPKTSVAAKSLTAAGISSASKVALFVSNDDLLTHASFANLPNVQLMLFDQANCYDLANAEYVAFLDKDLGAFNEMVARWN